MTKNTATQEIGVDANFLDAPSSDTDETRRESIAGILQYIEDEINWVQGSLRSNHAAGVKQHLKEILGWAQVGIDEMDDAK